MLFFDVDDIQYGSRLKKKFAAEIEYSCETCGLIDTCDIPMLRTFGEGHAGIMFVQDFPSRTDERRETPIVGTIGSMVKDVLHSFDLDLRRDCFSVCAIACNPYNAIDRMPEDKANAKKMFAMRACQKRLLKHIQKLKPRLVIPLGFYALRGLLDGRTGDTDVTSTEYWRGWHIPDRELECWIAPVLDPLYVSSKAERHDGIERLWQKDLIKAIPLADKPLPTYSNEVNNVEILTNPDEINKYLKHLTQQGNKITAAWDYETTGLKPHRKGHEIYTASISAEPEHAVAWRHTSATAEAFADFLDSEVKKIAANMKFEEGWSIHFFGKPVRNWVLDTMLAAHVLDNRRQITGLKFQSVINYGVYDYDSHISAYLKAENDKNGNSFNRIKQANLKDILVYNGVDSILERRLGMDQMEKLTKMDLWSAYNRLHEGAIALGGVEQDGIPTDKDHISSQQRKLNFEISEVHKGIFTSPLGKKWRSIYGDKSNINSDQQLAHILKLEGVTLTKKTDSGQDAMGKDVLEGINHPLAPVILQYRKLRKADSFLAGIKRETVDGLCHPFFQLHNVVSYRSSSASPNFQNFPKRDEEMMKIVRSAFKAPPGMLFLEADYSGVEVRISYCYHKDPTMRNYLLDPTTDMHRDMACQIFMLDHDEYMQAAEEPDLKKPMKTVRHAGKNLWVFPSFYGASAKSCAASFWQNMSLWGLIHPDGRPMTEHIRRMGIKNFQMWQEWLDEVYEDFWYNRFPVYQKWKDKVWREYCRNGFLRTYTGFLLQGLMNYNDVINYPAQGSAFHCLLWSLVRMRQRFFQEKMQTRILGQIHDSIFMLSVPEEVETVYKVSNEIMINKLTENHPWITIPMDVEMDYSPVGGTWAEQSTYKPGVTTF